MGRSSTTFPRKWSSQSTKVIRVPAHTVEALLRVAHRLDNSTGFRLREEPGSVVLELASPKPVHYTAEKPVNVSSVPHRSPFRYPGGKTWLVPYIRSWLKSRTGLPVQLIEPFAGGATVSLTAAFEHLAKHVIFAELDDGVAAVWRVVLNGQAEWLARRITSFDLTLANVRRLLDAPAATVQEKAFQTILRNRVQRGGIMAAGAGLIKTGEKSRGLASRWYASTLANRIREINLFKERLTFVEGDGFEVIQEHKEDGDAVFYIDPPYTVAARRLYTKWQMDQARLFKVMSECRGDFLMSYDNTVEVVELARKHGFQSRAIAMKNTHHAKMTELLIGRDLSWIEADNTTA